MTEAPTPTEKSKKQHDNIKTPPQTLITQRLRTDLRQRQITRFRITSTLWRTQIKQDTGQLTKSSMFHVYSL